MKIPYVFKKCSKCGRWLVASTFNFHKKKGGKYGLRTVCKECANVDNKKWRQENKEKIAEYQKNYYQENKEKVIERDKKYREENKEKIVEQRKKYYEQHREERIEYSKKYNGEHREERIAYKKKYNEEHKEKIAEQMKKWHEENKEKKKIYNKKYYEEHKEERGKYYKKWSKSPQGQAVIFNNGNKRRKREEKQGNGITGQQWLEMMRFFGFKCAYSGEYIGGKENQSIRSIDHIVPLVKGGAHEIWNCVPMYRPYNISKHDKDIKEWYPQQDFYDDARLNKINEWREYAYNKWSNDEIQQTI